MIAIVLRGDRGLEQFAPPEPQKLLPDCDRSSGRSRIGTAQLICLVNCLAKLRSFFGAIEDWNTSTSKAFNSLDIAIVLRGDRGLEHTSREV